MKSSVVISSGNLVLCVDDLKYFQFKSNVSNKVHKYLKFYKNGVEFHSINLNMLGLKFIFINDDGIKFYELINR